MAREEVQVAFNIELETRKLQSRMALFDKTIKKTAKNVADLSKKDFWFGSGKDFDKSLKKAEKAHEDYAKTLQDQAQKIFDVRSQLANATNADERKLIDERVKLYEQESVEIIKAARNVAKESKSALQDSLKISTGDLAKQLSTISLPSMKLDGFAKEIADEAKDAVTEGISAIKSKDLAGIFKGGSGLAAALLKGAGGYAGAGLKKGGGALHEKGAAMAGRAGAGGMDKALGGALKGIGKALGGLGGMVGMFAKMGPLVSTLSSALVGIVKMMIDIESQGKEINKEILEGAGTAELFAKQGWNVNRSMASLDETLQDVKDQAHDVKMNLSMGTNAKQHLAVIKVFNQEGVSLGDLKERLDANRESADKMRQSMSKYTDITRMAIGFSRLFGVSVEEIAGFQAEMMTEIGVSLEDTKKEFARMTAAASDSGIAANKFFQIIRSVSSDLSLYGVRIGDVTKMLKGLGKVMNPRMAQKFVTSFAQGMKGVSSDDAFKMTLLGGPTAVADIGKDLAAQKSDIIKQIAAQANVSDAEAEALLKGGRDKQGRTLDKLGKDKVVTDIGAKRAAYSDAARGEKQLAAGGQYGAGMAAKGLSGYGAYSLKKRAALRLSGSKDLEGSIGLRGEKSAEVAGFGGEKFDELLGMERAMVQQQKDLANNVEDGDADTIAKLTKLGILNKKMNKADQLAAVRGMNEKQVFDSLAEDSDKAETNEQKMLKAAEEQGQRTQGIMEKLDVLIDALFNWLYKVMVGLWDTVVDLADSAIFDPTGKRSEERRLAKVQVEAAKTKNKEIMDLADKSTSAGDFHKKMFETAGAQGMEKTFYGGKERDSALSKQKDLGKKEFDLKEKLQKGGMSREDEAKAQEELKKVTAEKALADAEATKQIDKYNAAIRALNDQLGGAGKNVDLKNDRMLAAAKMAGVGGAGTPDGAKLSKAMGSIKQGNDIQVALESAGFSQEEQAKILDKIRLQLSPEQLAKATSDYQKATGGAPAPGAPGAPGGPAASGAAPMPVTVAPSTTPQQVALAPTAKPMPVALAPAAAGAPLPVAPGPLPDVVGAVHDQSEHTVGGFDDLWTAMRVKGIKLDKSITIDNHLKKAFEEGALAALRKGLFEYALYTSSDPKHLLEQMEKSGFADVGGMASSFKDDPKNAAFLGGGNATGGIVTSVQGGIAKIDKLPPGEGLAAIGAGERISPAGAGGGGGNNSINLTVNGIGGQDLANFLKVKIAEGIYEYKRREKLT